MNYKKIFKSQKLRFIILKFLLFVPDSIMLKWQYRIKFERALNLKNPKRFTEILQLYKMNYRNSDLAICVDKYEVRNFIKGKNLEYILNDIYGVYSNANEIDFEKLPSEFVIKTTDGGGQE